MFNLFKYDPMQINAAWAAIVAAVIVGMCAIIAAIVSSSARNPRKSLGITLSLLLTIILVVGIFFVAGAISPSVNSPLAPSSTYTSTPSQTVTAFLATHTPTNAPMTLQVRITHSLPLVVYSAPSTNSSAKYYITLNSVSITVLAMVVGMPPPGYLTNIWYQVNVHDVLSNINGYIFGEFLQLIPPSNNPNAAPPLVTLTPMPVANLSQVPIPFQARIVHSIPLVVYSAPSTNSSAKYYITLNSVSITVLAMVVGTPPPGYRTNIWCQVNVHDVLSDINGYIFGEFLQLIPPSNNPNATPPMVTLTPTPTR